MDGLVTTGGLVDIATGSKMHVNGIGASLVNDLLGDSYPTLTNFLSGFRIGVAQLGGTINIATGGTLRVDNNVVTLGGTLYLNPRGQLTANSIMAIGGTVDNHYGSITIDVTFGLGGHIVNYGQLEAKGAYSDVLEPLYEAIPVLSNFKQLEVGHIQVAGITENNASWKLDSNLVSVGGLIKNNGDLDVQAIVVDDAGRIETTDASLINNQVTWMVGGTMENRGLIVSTGLELSLPDLPDWNELDHFFEEMENEAHIGYFQSAGDMINEGWISIGDGDNLAHMILKGDAYFNNKKDAVLNTSTLYTAEDAKLENHGIVEIDHLHMENGTVYNAAGASWIVDGLTDMHGGAFYNNGHMDFGHLNLVAGQIINGNVIEVKQLQTTEAMDIQMVGGVMRVEELMDGSHLNIYGAKEQYAPAVIAIKDAAESSTVHVYDKGLVVVGTNDEAHAVKTIGDEIVFANEVTGMVYFTHESPETKSYEPIAGRFIVGKASTYAANDRTASYIYKGGLFVVDMDDSDVTGSIPLLRNTLHVYGGDLYLANAELGQEIKITAGEFNYHSGDVRLSAGDRLLSGVITDDDTVLIVMDQEKVDNVFPDLIAKDTIVSLFNEGKNAEKNLSAQFANQLMSLEKTNGLTDAEILQVGNDAAKMVGTSGMIHATLDTAQQARKALALHTGLTTQRHDGLGVWAETFGGSVKGERVVEGAGYSSDIYGAIFGLRATMPCGANAGITVAYGDADSDSRNTTAVTTTKSDFWSLGLYATRNVSENMNITVDASYTHGSHEISGYARKLNFDFGRTDTDTSLVAVGVEAQYRYTIGGMQFIPHAGLRYQHVQIDDVNTVFETQAESMNIVQVPVGLTIKADHVAKDGWTIAPQADITVLGNFADKDTELTLTSTGATVSSKYTLDLVDSMVVNTSMGIRARKGDWSMHMNYQFGYGHDDRNDSTIRAGVQYNF